LWQFFAFLLLIMSDLIVEEGGGVLRGYCVFFELKLAL